MAEDDAPTNNLTRFPVLHEPPTQPYLLSVVEGPARGTKVQLREGRWIVGRDPTAQLTINDPHISRQHIEVQVLPGAQGVLLRDLDSKNGSFMRNCRFIEAYVDEHALVSLGENTIVDIALETADVALMADDLSKLVTAIGTGRRTRGVVTQNLALSLAILATLVPLALFGLIALPVAVLAHELSELVVILNGTRMART